jgi:hypothetical protein
MSQLYSQKEEDIWTDNLVWLTESWGQARHYRLLPESSLPIARTSIQSIETLTKIYEQIEDKLKVMSTATNLKHGFN